MSEQASGWAVTVKIPGIGGSIVKIWYAACPDQATALQAVKKAVNTTGATFEISRAMSKTLMDSFGLRKGEVRCFD